MLDGKDYSGIDTEFHFKMALIDGATSSIDAAKLTMACNMYATLQMICFIADHGTGPQGLRNLLLRERFLT